MAASSVTLVVFFCLLFQVNSEKRSNLNGFNLQKTSIKSLKHLHSSICRRPLPVLGSSVTPIDLLPISQIYFQINYFPSVVNLVNRVKKKLGNGHKKEPFNGHLLLHAAFLGVEYPTPFHAALHGGGVPRQFPALPGASSASSTAFYARLEEGLELISGLRSLRVLNLSHNGFVGKLPESLSFLKNLNEVSLSNKLSGPVYQSFVENIPANAVVDLSFNALTGQIPQMMSLSNQKEEYFARNLDLCGKPLKKMCRIPSSHSIPTNVSSDGSATAAEFGEVTWVLLGRR
ncbi:hypothetical protein LXL04_037811 [Taraxacum kok-saghyz]